MGMLLSEGIGDTIRVSLSEDPIEEVKVYHKNAKAHPEKQIQKIADR